MCTSEPLNTRIETADGQDLVFMCSKGSRPEFAFISLSGFGVRSCSQLLSPSSSFFFEIEMLIFFRDVLTAHFQVEGTEMRVSQVIHFHFGDALTRVVF